MKSEVLAGFDWTILSNLALILFLGLFLSMVIWIFRKGSKKIYQEAADMPLNEEGEL